MVRFDAHMSDCVTTRSGGESASVVAHIQIYELAFGTTSATITARSAFLAMSDRINTAMDTHGVSGDCIERLDETTRVMPIVDTTMKQLQQKQQHSVWPRKVDGGASICMRMVMPTNCVST